MRRLWLVFLCLVALAVACSTDDGLNGPAGQDASVGEDAPDASESVSVKPSTTTATTIVPRELGPDPESDGLGVETSTDVPAVDEDGRFVVNYVPAGFRLTREDSRPFGNAYQQHFVGGDASIGSCNVGQLNVRSSTTVLDPDWMAASPLYDEITIGDQVIYRHAENSSPWTGISWPLAGGGSLAIGAIGVAEEELIRVGESVRPTAETIVVNPPVGSAVEAPITLQRLTQLGPFVVTGNFNTTAPRSIEVGRDGSETWDVVEFDIGEKLFVSIVAQGYGAADADLIDVVVPPEVTSAVVADAQATWVLMLVGITTAEGRMGTPECGAAGIFEVVGDQTLRSLDDRVDEFDLATVIERLQAQDT